MSDPIRVLHVIDDNDFADLTKRSLEAEADEFTVISAYTPEEGMEILETEDIDCLVSDYDMPEQNGIEFLNAVRDQFSDLPFILYTGRGSEQVAMRAVSAGVSDYVCKEIRADHFKLLANRIRGAVESYRSKKELAERNQQLRRYKQMVNSMDEAACVYNDDGRFEIVNEYLASWYNTTRSELEGQQSNLIPSIRNQTEDADPYQALLDGDRAHLSGEINTAFPKHGEAVLEYRLTPLEINGEIEGVVGVARDITEEKQRQEKLQKERDRLDEFASVVSHDLQNPLQVAEGRLAMAKDDCDSEHLPPIERALERMERIIDDVLTLARQGDDIGTTDDVPLADPVSDGWEMVADNIETVDLQYADERAAQLTVEADDNRLCELFENLFRNAIEHGGEDVTVTIGLLTNGFYVADDGPGIPENKRSEVFSAGFSTNTDGTGFGLSIVEQIVAGHGWTIDVTESSAGGARFEITDVNSVNES